MSEHLTVSEYERGQKTLERMLAQGFSSIERRFDRLDDVTDTHGERLAVVEAAIDEAKQTATKTSAKTVGWGSAIAGVVVVIVEVFKSLAK